MNLITCSLALPLLDSRKSSEFLGRDEGSDQDIVPHAAQIIDIANIRKFIRREKPCFGELGQVIPLKKEIDACQS